jgi:hypothetical protein
MMAGKVVYSIDTSALLHGWRRAYPQKRFPALWAKIEGLIHEGRLVASIEVFHELEKKDDELFEWAKAHKEALFRDIDDDVQAAVVHVMQTYPKLVDTGKGKSGGDPFVIAQALVGNPPLVVITQEAGGSQGKPKIPFVCQAEGLTCIDLLAMIEAEDWAF